jgi:hypothetical protein
LWSCVTCLAPAAPHAAASGPRLGPRPQGPPPGPPGGAPRLAWQPAPNLGQPRAHAGVVACDGALFVLGGRSQVGDLTQLLTCAADARLGARVGQLAKVSQGQG